MMLPKGWKKVKLGDVAKVTSGGTPLRTQTEYWDGDIPWVKTAQIQNRHISKDQVDEYITELGVKESSAKIVPKGTLLMAMYGQGKTRGQVAILDIDATINQACAAFNLKENEVSTQYLFQYFLFNYDNIRNLSNDGGQKNLSAEIIKKIPLDLPPLEEQKKIAATLSVWDSAIEKMEKLIEALEERYQSYVNDFFFENQNDKRKLKMGDVFAVRNDRSIATENMPLYSLTIENGITAKTDRYDRGALVKDKDSKKYKIVCDGDIVYNPANLRWGAIGQSKVGHNVVVSPIYEVLYARDNCNNSRYLSHYIMSKKMIAFYSSKTEGTLIERKEVKIDQFLRIDLYIEKDPVRQKKIADVLDMHQEEISNLKQQLENYKKQKQGLMQKLLTGQWRVK